MSLQTTTLAEIVTRRPDAASILARHHLDFCCHGQRSLAVACEEASLDAAVVAAEIDAMPPADAPADDWTTRPLGEVIDHILVRYHEPLRRDLPVLIEQARTVERVHAGKVACPHGLADLLEGILAAVESHLQKEEQILFPLIRAGRGPMAFMPVRVMEQEHVQHGENIARIRRMTDDLVVPPEGCATWKALYAGLARLEADLFEHIHLENYVLFPRALQGDSTHRA